jgi:hypothetical protein
MRWGQVLVYGQRADTLCKCVLGLLSLLPRAVRALVPLAHAGQVAAAEDDGAANAAGLPLALWPDQDPLRTQPYLSLLQLEWLAALNGPVLAGVSNRLFVMSRERLHLDCVVNVRLSTQAVCCLSAQPAHVRGSQVDEGTVEVYQAALAQALAPTASDRRFAAMVAAPPADVADVDGWLRQQFQAYLLGALASGTPLHHVCAHTRRLTCAEGRAPVVTVDAAIARATAAAAAGQLAEQEAAEASIARVYVDDFHYRWLARWRTTPALVAWRARYDAGALPGWDAAAHVGHPTHTDELTTRLLRYSRLCVHVGVCAR